jgi:hypothetical protein
VLQRRRDSFASLQKQIASATPPPPPQRETGGGAAVAGGGERVQSALLLEEMIEGAIGAESPPSLLRNAMAGGGETRRESLSRQKRGAPRDLNEPAVLSFSQWAPFHQLPHGRSPTARRLAAKDPRCGGAAGAAS